METTSKTFWQTACELKIGPVPAPVYLVLAVIVAAATIFGQLPADMVGGIAIMMVMGILLGDIGLKVPILKDIGGPAILSIFIPSAMVYYGLLNSDAIKAITAFTKGANFLYFYISCLVVGSILGMVRTVLVQGFLRMFVPLVVGTVVASILGCIAGMLCGEDLYHTFFFIVIPILSGGVGEGILPLAAAYSEILNQSADQFLVHFVPAAMLGNLFAIMSAGYLKKMGERFPKLSGNGTLVKSGDLSDITNAKAEEAPLDVKMMGAGLVLACCFFCAAKVLALWIPIPAPILMIILAALIKVLNIMPTVMEQGAKQWYKFVSGNLTWALLVGVGVIYTPWNDVLAAITPAYIFTIMATIFGMVVSGLLCARFMNMYPIESAIVTCCHSGLGGTGDVAILSAANRMGLMPFAQISTRLGGACTVIAATILMRASVNRSHPKHFALPSSSFMRHIMRQGQAGTLESNDAVITVAEAPAGSGIIIDLESSVKAAYGDAIEAVIRDACREAGIEDAEVDVRDKGALDCTIRARTLTAITRAGL